MTVTIYFSAPNVWDEYRDVLPTALSAAGITARLVTEAADPATVDYIIYAPSSPLQDFTPFTRTKAVLNLWAGVERIVGNPTLTQPLNPMRKRNQRTLQKAVLSPPQDKMALRLPSLMP